MRFKLTIPKKIILGFGLMAIAIVISTAFTYITLKQNYKIINKVDDVYEPSEANLHSLLYEITNSKMLIKNWVFIDYKSDTPNKKNLLKLHKENFPRIKNRLEPLVKQWNEEARLEYYHIIDLIEDSLFVFHEEVINSLTTFEDYNNPMVKFEMMSLVQEEDDPIMLISNLIMNHLDGLIIMMGTEFANAKLDMDNSLSSFKIMIMITSISLLLFIILLAIASKYIIVNPLVKLQEATNEISVGNYNPKIDINTGDELELLGNAFISMAHNIEDNENRLRETNNQLRKSEKALKESNATKDKFLSILAHDLKAPFSSLVSVSEVVANNDNKLSEGRKRGFTKSIHTTAVQLHSLIDNLLQWSRAQTNRMHYEPERVMLRGLVVNTIELISINSREKNILIKNEIPDDIMVFADPNLISVILRNLLSNAVKYTYQGGEIRIILEESCHQFYRIMVKDNGMGISKEDQEMLFRIDIDTKFIGTSTEKGTGLGLVLIKEFVELNGGEVAVESELGIGSNFSFTLKRYNPQNKSSEEGN